MSIVTPSDKYDKRQLADKLLTAMQRRAAFAAKCTRENAEINKSASVKTRVFNQWKLLCENAGVVVPTVAPIWAKTSGAVTIAGDVVITPIALKNNVTLAAYKTAHTAAKTEFEKVQYGPLKNVNYVDSLVWS
jgi:hypothetical protein